MDPDARWMIQFREGDPAAFEKLFEKYQRPVLNFCFRFLGHAQDAEDVAQETFVRAYRSAANYQPLAKFSTWLFTIAKNLCLNRLREKGIPEAALAGGETDEGPQLEQTLPADGPGPEEEAAGKEIAEIVQEAVAALPPLLRLPLVLSRYHELSYEEIAGIMDCSVTAVKLRLYRAKRVLARRLGPRLGRD